jgi:hypothetical protein
MVWKAKATGKKYLGRGKACSRYTTSAPDLEGKYEVSSRYTEIPESEMSHPSTQKIRLRPTEPVPRRIPAATKCQSSQLQDDLHDSRVEKIPVPINIDTLRKVAVQKPTL